MILKPVCEQLTLIQSDIISPIDIALFLYQ